MGSLGVSGAFSSCFTWTVFGGMSCNLLVHSVAVSLTASGGSGKSDGIYRRAPRALGWSLPPPQELSGRA
eukprot:4374299-Alexandrium_andersonii.AAC.1